MGGIRLGFRVSTADYLNILGNYYGAENVIIKSVKIINKAVPNLILEGIKGSTERFGLIPHYMNLKEFNQNLSSTLKAINAEGYFNITFGISAPETKTYKFIEERYRESLTYFTADIRKEEKIGKNKPYIIPGKITEPYEKEDHSDWMQKHEKKISNIWYSELENMTYSDLPKKEETIDKHKHIEPGFAYVDIVKVINNLFPKDSRTKNKVTKMLDKAWKGYANKTQY